MISSRPSRAADRWCGRARSRRVPQSAVEACRSTWSLRSAGEVRGCRTIAPASRRPAGWAVEQRGPRKLRLAALDQLEMADRGWPPSAGRTSSFASTRADPSALARPASRPARRGEGEGRSRAAARRGAARHKQRSGEQQAPNHGPRQILVEHQRIVVGIEEGEQPDQARNLHDVAVLADAMLVELGLGGLDVGHSEGQRRAARAARFLPLRQADIDPGDAGLQLAPGDVVAPVEQVRSRARRDTRRSTGRGRSRRASRSARHHKSIAIAAPFLGPIFIAY